MMYVCRHLKKQVQESVLLDIASLELQRGQMYGLLGPNGAGKTTLLNILAFLEPPSSGDIFFAGDRVDFSPSQCHALRRHVVMVDQHPVLFSGTVHDNIAFGLKIRKISAPVREQKIDDVLDMVGLRALKYEPVQQLSSGETQRIALARALVLSPDVLLCDEPTANVDVENQTVIGNILQEMNTSRKMTIVVATHDRLQVASLACATISLNKGRSAATCFDNTFSCTVRRVSSRIIQCHLAGTIPVLLDAPDEQPPDGCCQVTISPEKIQLVPPSQQSDGTGLLMGRLVQLTEEGERVAMSVDVGILLMVSLSQKMYLQFRPAINETVFLKIPDDAIRYF